MAIDAAKFTNSDSGAIDATCSLAIEAAADAEGQPRKGPRRFSMQAYNGGPLKVDNYPLPVYVDLAGLECARPTLPTYFGHDNSKIVGHTDKHDATSGKYLIAAGAISGANQFAQEVLASHDAGFPWQASIRAMPKKGELCEIRAGQNSRVNGREVTGPCIIARKSTLQHIAILPEGADATTSVSIAASAAHASRKEHAMEFEKWVEALGFDMAELTDQQIVACQKKYDGEIEAAKAKATADAKMIDAAGGGTVKAPTIEAPRYDLSAVVLAGEKHMATIDAKCATYAGKIDAAKLSDISSKARTAAANLKLSAIDGEWPATRLEVEAIKAQAAVEVELIRAERPAAPAIHSSTRDMSQPAIEAALCMSAGLGTAALDKQFKPEVLEAAQRHHRGMRLQELLIIQAQANGYADRAFRVHDGNMREILRCAFGPIQAAFSTVSLPNVFSNVANKFLMEGYGFVESAWREFSAIRSVKDFKTITSVRLTENAEYEEVGPTGEIKHGALGEETYTNQAKTYAKMLGLSRQDIINDDLGAFDTLRQRLGRGGALKLNSVFYTEFLNDSAFWTAGRGNYYANAAAVLGLTGLTTVEQMFNDLVDAQGAPTGGSPAILLVPTNLIATANSLYVAPELRDTTSSTKYTTANVFQGKYRPIMSRYLNKTTISGSSTTAWYLLADPRDRAAMEVCFLDGQETPTVQSAEANFNVLGIEFRGFHDFGVAKKEWLAGVKSKGAA